MATGIRAGVLAALPLGLLPTTSMAAAAGEPAVGTLEEVIVTAQRRETRLQDTPISIATLSGERLESAGIRDIRGLQEYVPGLTVHAGPQGGSDAHFFIRGVGQNDLLATTDPGVALYIGGVYIARTTGAGLDLVDVERIEVLRGPQGTLFGRNAVGGAIVVVPRRPAETLGADVSLTLGSRDRADGRVVLDVPLVDGSLYSRLALLSRTQDGWGRLAESGRSLGDRETLGARLSVDFRPSDAWQLDLAADYSRIRGTTVPFISLGAIPNRPVRFTDRLVVNGVPLIVAPVQIGTTPADIAADTSPNDRVSFQSGDPRDSVDAGGVALTASWRINPGLQLKSITAFRSSDQESGSDFDGTRVIGFDQILRTDQRQLSQELQLSGSALGERLQWVAGAFWFDEEIDQFNRVGNGATVRRVEQLVNQRSSVVDGRSWAVFGQGSLALTSRLSATLGLRYSDERKDFTSDNFIDNRNGFIAIRNGFPVDAPVALLPRFPRFSQSDAWTSTTPKASLEFKPTPDVLLYGSFARGFKSGGFNGRASSLAAVSTFEPETADTYEAGLKSELFGRRLRVNVAAFRTSYDDIQLTAPVFTPAGPVFQILNASEARLYGGELEIEARPVEALEFSIGVAHNDFRFERFRVPLTLAGVTLANELPNNPEWTVNAGVAATLPLGNFGTGSVRADWSWRSRFFYTINNNPRELQPAYGLVNLRASLRPAGERWEVGVFGLNVLDERYATWGQDSRNVFGYSYVNPGRPREWGVDATYRWR